MSQNLFELANRPIPLMSGRVDLSTVATHECGQPLVPVTSVLSQAIRCNPQYRLRGVPHSLDCCYCRQGVARKLAQISDWLRRLPPDAHHLGCLAARRRAKGAV